MSDENTIQYEPILSFENWIGSHDRRYQEIEMVLLRLKEFPENIFDDAIKMATRWAAIETGAIENLYETDRGLTYSIAAQADIISYTAGRHGDDFAAHLQDQINGYEFVLDFATNNRPLAPAWVRELHAVICAGQEYYTVVVDEQLGKRKLIHGSYKDSANNVTLASGLTRCYCPIESTSEQMQFLLDQLQTSHFTAASPVAQAAYSHHAFTQIHPFSDGNGRVARALASVFLIRAYKIPYVLYSDQRETYYNALENADKRKVSGFLNIVFESTRSALEQIELNMRAAMNPDPVETVDNLKRKLGIGKRKSKKEMQDLAIDLLKSVGSIVGSKANNNEFEGRLRLTGSIAPRPLFEKSNPMPAGYISIQNGSVYILQAHAVEHAADTISRIQVFVLVPEDSSQLDRFIVMPDNSARDTAGRLEIPIEEVENEFSSVTLDKFDKWSDLIVHSVFLKLSDKLKGLS